MMPGQFAISATRRAALEEAALWHDGQVRVRIYLEYAALNIDGQRASAKAKIHERNAAAIHTLADKEPQK